MQNSNKYGEMRRNDKLCSLLPSKFLRFWSISSLYTIEMPISMSIDHYLGIGPVITLLVLCIDLPMNIYVTIVHFRCIYLIHVQ
jgi:hypothetical protein